MQFYDVTVHIFRVQPGILPNGIVRVCYTDEINNSKPAMYIIGTDYLMQDMEWEYECYPNCIVEIYENGDIEWMEV